MFRLGFTSYPAEVHPGRPLFRGRSIIHDTTPGMVNGAYDGGANNARHDATSIYYNEM